MTTGSINSKDLPRNRIGIVGFGRMAEVGHLRQLREAGWNVAAALDITPARRDAAIALGIPAVFDDWADFFDQGRPDAVLLTTHSSYRIEGVKRIVGERGLPVLIEKPLAMSAREGWEICQLCDREKVLCSVYHNRRWDPDYLRIKAIIRRGSIGKVFRVENRLFEKEPATRFGTDAFHQQWRITASMGGGSMLDWGPHLMDQVLSLMTDELGHGRVMSILGEVRHVHFGDADDHFMIELVFESGAHALIGKCDVAPIGPRYKWVVLGDGGSLVADWESATWQRALNGVAPNGDHPVIDSSAPEPASIHRNFLEAVNGRADLLVTARQSLRTLEVFDAARKSAGHHASVPVSI